MRGRIAVAAVAAGLLLGGCSDTPAPPGPAVAPSLVTAGPEVRAATGDAARQAAAVAAAWPGSAAQQAWEHGYFPTADTSEWLPPGAFRSGEDKAAYTAGHLDLQATLPVSVADTAEVQFADGSRLVLPQRSAKEVFEELTRSDRPCSGHCDARLTVTGVRPGTTTVPTSRGQATIPVWEFTVAGYDGPFRYPAVRSQDPYRPAPGPGPAGATTLRSVSADGLVLTAGVPHGSCDTVQPGEVYETDLAVVLIGRIAARSLPAGQACDLALRVTPVEFRLARPLGARAVLGLADGRPQTLPAAH
ncbi:hypothetical protein ACFV1L_14620 [Kitasatospora sp. NPDC059646]|uniref:hypothetical protein n=1 Tax=Kitasatospora sp. NPDC059646 TaxID=3346893 RepID=UPI0036B9679C